MQTQTYIPFSYIIQFTPNKVHHEMKTSPVTKTLLSFTTQRPEHWIDDDRALASSRQFKTTWQRKGSMKNIITHNHSQFV
jgi:hypothetical protein